MFKRVSTKCALSSWGGEGFGYLLPNGWGEGGMKQPFSGRLHYLAANRCNELRFKSERLPLVVWVFHRGIRVSIIDGVIIDFITAVVT